MYPLYRDIREKLGTPKWIDKHGVPRYSEFSPEEAIEILAKENEQDGKIHTQATAWVERTRTRYYWNGKGYHSKTAVCRAIAKKEAVIWCAKIAPMFSSNIGRIIRENAVEHRGELSWWIAALFANVGSNGSHFYYGTHFWATPPWESWIKRRVNHLLCGDKPMIVKGESGSDFFQYEWEFPLPKLAVVHGLPFASEFVDGKTFTSPDEIHSLFYNLYLQYAEEMLELSDYESFLLMSPLDMIHHHLKKEAGA